MSIPGFEGKTHLTKEEFFLIIKQNEKRYEEILDDVVNQLFRLVDIDNDGLVSVPEFLRFAAICEKVDLREKAGIMVMLFKLADTNNDGVIDKEELKKFLVFAGVTDEKYNGLFAALDANQNGVIEFNEFMALFKQ